MREFTVETLYNPNEIEQIVRDVRFDQPEIIARHIIQLRERGVRDALIALGWTPPLPSNTEV